MQCAISILPSNMHSTMLAQMDALPHLVAALELTLHVFFLHSIMLSFNSNYSHIMNDACSHGIQGCLYSSPIHANLKKDRPV